jgi:hypothetical protein
MWSVETFLEVHINDYIKKIPITSSLTDNDSIILYKDLVIKTELGWTKESYSILYPMFIPFDLKDISSIIKKQHKYKVFC